MEKDYAGEMMTLKEYLEKNGKNIDNIRYIGNVELIELINKEPYTLNKEVYVCEEKIIDENGKEIQLKEFYTEDFEKIAIEDDRYEKAGNALMLNSKYEKQPELAEIIKELDKQEKIDLNKINEENLDKIVEVVKTLNIDKGNVKDISEIDLEKIQNPESTNKIETKSEISVNANEKITTRDTMATMLGVDGKGYKKIDVVRTDDGNGFKFVGIKENGQMEGINSFEPIYGINPNRNINAVNNDGTKIKDEQSNAMFKIKGREDEQLAIKYGDYYTTRISLVRTSYETNESISIPVEANTIVHTNHEEKEFMDSRKNPKMTAETKRLEEHKEHDCDPITKQDIDDDPTNDTYKHFDEEYIPNTNIRWQDFANGCGYRGADGIERAQEKFDEEREKHPELDNEQIAQDTIEEQEEDFDNRKRLR